MTDHFSSHTGLTIDLPLQLERTSPVPLTQQLIVQVRQAILAGQLAPGMKLPSTRGLAQVLGLSRTTVLDAYDELLAEGYLIGKSGSGTFVSHDMPAAPPAVSTAVATLTTPRWLRVPDIVAAVNPDGPAGVIDFRVGQPMVASLSDAAWKRAWRRVAAEGLPSTYMDAAGDPSLRTALAAYLRRTRGLSCDADDIIITSGAIQGLHLIARAVLADGDSVAIEEPGYRLAQQVVTDRGASLLPIPVDSDGLRVMDLPVGSATPPLVYLTPSHQFPLGSRLSVPRRHALISWATVHDSLLIEDDYDGEFRYDTTPLPALAALDPHRVAYLGTFSKVLSPALRVGYVVAPKALRVPLIALKTIADYHTSWPVQRVLAEFLLAGDLERHLGRMRRVYARKRALLVRALEPARAWARVGGLHAGFHVHVDLDLAVAASTVAQLAAARGVLVQTLVPFYTTLRPQNGLVLGYGGLDPDQIRQGIQVVVETILATAP